MIYTCVRKEVRTLKITSHAAFKAIRAEKGFSITGLARAMQVSPSVVFNIEHGKNIRPATARKACEALGVTFDMLFTIAD